MEYSYNGLGQYSSSTVFLLDDDGNEVSQVLIAFKDNSWQDGNDEIKTESCHLWNVRSFVEGKGYATMLLEHIEDVIIKMGCLEITLDVIVSNDVAIHLYEKLGYKRIDKIDNTSSHDHKRGFAKFYKYSKKLVS